jgi:hypothetical protein
MGKIYKTAKGVPIDMATLVEKNKNTSAIGNMGVNANGDKVGKGGEIIQTSKERVQEYYQENKNTTRESVSIKDSADKAKSIPLDKEESKSPTSNKKTKASVKSKEKTLEDGSIEIIDTDLEDADGDVVDE